MSRQVLLSPVMAVFADVLAGPGSPAVKGLFITIQSCASQFLSHYRAAAYGGSDISFRYRLAIRKR